MTTLTIEQALALAAVLNGGQKANPNPDPSKVTEAGDGRPVIVRSRDAGVLFGDYDGREGCNIKLKNARQMWQWFADKGGTLVDCAENGVVPSKCKFSIASATVTVFNACALIDCSAAAATSIRNVEGGAWK